MNYSVNNDWGGLHLTPQERENRVALLESFYNNPIVGAFELSPFHGGELLVNPHEEVGNSANQPRKRNYEIFAHHLQETPQIGESTNSEEGELQGESL